MKKKLAILVATAAMTTALAAGPASADDIDFLDNDLINVQGKILEDEAEILEDYYEALGWDIDEEDILLDHHWGPLGLRF
jgi:hypothetical protein